MSENKTLVLNLFGGAGSGKSTLAAYIFACLKDKGVNAELVQEYAKDLAWDGTLKGSLERDLIGTQEEILEEQSKRLRRLKGKVEIIITDSPIMLHPTYGSDPLKCKAVTEEFDNINVFVNRAKPYNPSGRVQTEEEATAMDELFRPLTDLHVIGRIYESSVNKLTDLIFYQLRLEKVNPNCRGAFLSKVTQFQPFLWGTL